VIGRNQKQNQKWEMGNQQPATGNFQSQRPIRIGQFLDHCQLPVPGFPFPISGSGSADCRLPVPRFPFPISGSGSAGCRLPVAGFPFPISGNAP
jgi:hypothetical protein